MDDNVTQKLIRDFVQQASLSPYTRASSYHAQPTLSPSYHAQPTFSPWVSTGEPLVLCGPIVGTVTETTANVLLEIDEDAQVTCTATPCGVGSTITDVRNLKGNVPEVFTLLGLSPGAEYKVTFNPLAAVQARELEQRGCVVRTMPPAAQMKRLRIIALSCDRPARLLPGQENPWSRLADVCRAGECDIMLHLGDQVYTKENDWKSAAERVMDICEKPGVSQSVQLKAELEGSLKLQQAYRATWYPPDVATVLARSSHIMIWSDNDVANDFTVLKKRDGSQAYTPSFLRVGMRVYRMYQRQLWDPACVLGLKALEAQSDVEEWHFHVFGPCGIFMIDMRGNRIRPNGTQKEGPILSARQRTSIEDAFKTSGLTCMIVCSEIPFVGDPHDVIVHKQKKLIFLKDHWPYQIEELTWLLDLCFGWKAAVGGREVIMLGGDIHVSVESVITDRQTFQTIKHITTSPITNHVCAFYPEVEGSLNERYSYLHRPMPGMRTFCTIDLNFEESLLKADVTMVGVPTSHATDPPGVENVLVLCGPVVGTVTETTANVMLEVDMDAQITCKARPTDGGPTVADARKLKKGVPEVFRLEGLKSGTEYRITFDPLARVQARELQQRGCVVRTMSPASQMKRLRFIALSCDRPARLKHNQENPWARLATICKAGECDVMLHLGDQVYTKEYNWMISAMRLMDICENPLITPAVRLKAEYEGSTKLQEAYRATWYPPEVATVLAHTSHIMIWSDNDVANDFTILKRNDGSQAYTPSFLRVGMRVYRMYQRQLWDHSCVFAGKALEERDEVEEWNFHRFGPCGVFMIDMRGNRIRPDGTQKDGPILSARQKKAIEEAFCASGLTCMLICSEIPFVGDPPDVIVEKQKKFPFLADHWPYQIQELMWLLDLCFGWKVGASGREVIMLAGDIHVSVESVITDKHTGHTIKHVTTSPITNHVCGFYPELQGSLTDRYSYSHKPMLGMRTFCTIDLNIDADKVNTDVGLVGVPAKEDE